MGGKTTTVALAAVLLGALAVAEACGSEAFQCVRDEQCVDAGLAGHCEASGYCSFDDDGCPSEHRYGDHAPDGLAGQCVPLGPDATGTADSSDPSTSGPAATSTSEGEDSGLPVTVTPSDTDMVGGDTSNSTSASTGLDDTTAGTDDTGPGPLGPFVDEFDRPDGPAIGNGWIEKNPDAFHIVSEHVAFDTAWLGYADDVVHRPLSESLLDLELSVQVQFSFIDPPGFPQLHARVQADDIDVPGSINAYILFVQSADTLMITRQEAGEFSHEISSPLDTVLDVTTTYRLRMRVTGTNPVMVEGWMERLEGSEWIEMASVVLADDDPTRIDTAGTWGFPADSDPDHHTYDHFTMDPL